MQKKYGISLIVLVIVIIIMIILAGATIIITSNVISQATKARFYEDMKAIEEVKELTKLETFLNNRLGEETSTPFLSRNVTSEEIKEFEDTLKAEIIYVRNAFGEKERLTTKQVWKNNMFECQEMYTVSDYLDGLSSDIYYINSKAISVNKENTYIYDSVSDTCFKVAKTTIGKYVVHSLEYAEFIIDGKDAVGVGVVDDESKAAKATDGTLYYEPDLNNFSYATEIVYYSPDFSTEYTITAEEFIEEGKQATKVVNGETYTFANYTSTGTKVWANIKTTANGLDSYWVWIPRFAYKLDASVAKSEKAEIIFVDINDKPMDTTKYGAELPEGYTVHEAFKQHDGLKGIWFSKYAPVSVESAPIDNTEPATPDLTNFNTAELKIVYYTADGNSSIEKDYTTNPARTITEDSATYYWYNYTNKLWANIKTTANGLDSYWVWIPRFAYKLESGTTKVIFVDENNKPLDTAAYGSTLPNGYKIHEAFEQEEGLLGIWFSKYAPVSVESAPIDNTEPATPDLTNFNTAELKIVYYTADGNSSIEKDYTTNPARTITEDGATYYWYNYTNKIWANIKTTANGLDSYWVWIPRFAYKAESGTSKVIFVDENNKPLDTAAYGSTLPNGYKIHEAFEQEEGLLGIWFSKYAPAKDETPITTE